MHASLTSEVYRLGQLMNVEPRSWFYIAYLKIALFEVVVIEIELQSPLAQQGSIFSSFDVLRKGIQHIVWIIRLKLKVSSFFWLYCEPCAAFIVFLRTWR